MLAYLFGDLRVLTLSPPSVALPEAKYSSTLYVFKSVGCDDDAGFSSSSSSSLACKVKRAFFRRDLYSMPEISVKSCSTITNKILADVRKKTFGT
uniref:Uncharacterized protein n=1 Tax=Romanomermis culicivorax TaxID=13658 RepID=A0A915IK66_ROMCU